MTDVLTEANNIISSELPTVTIAKAEYDFLKRGAYLLAALQRCGVEDWEGFDQAVAGLSFE